MSCAPCAPVPRVPLVTLRPSLTRVIVIVIVPMPTSALRGILTTGLQATLCRR